jgi:cob(I)alamin adenosyltransferase
MPNPNGLLIVHTGSGKGKTTAALGMLLRSLGHGHSCAVVQFIKGAQPTAETLLTQVAAATGAQLVWDRCGQGFTWTTRDPQIHQAAAREGWEAALRHLRDPALRFLLLDELAIALGHGYLEIGEVLDALQQRAPRMHVVVTGRGAPEALVEAADLVTEMQQVKHPFKAGVKAQAGIEY